MNELAYWIAIAHLPHWRNERINTLIANVLQEKNLSWPQFFELDSKEYLREFSLTPKESANLQEVRASLPEYSSLAEELVNQGCGFIPISSIEYPKILKENLKLKYAPPLLYVKGNTRLFKESTVAIVGSREVSEKGIQFTRAVAKRCSAEYKVIVSGYARGVDRMALETAIENYGLSIVVLPQGILTFQSGFKKLSPYLTEGQVLVVSTFPPKAGWSVGLAMVRNRYIYGLAEEIYVAESGSQGGTWNGVLDGLKQGRRIFVRAASPDEPCANNQLIARGAIAVDELGKVAQKDKKMDFPVHQQELF